MDIFSLVGKLALENADKVKSELQGIEGFVEKNKVAFRAMGVAMTAVGAAGLKFVSDARKVNAQLGSTAITLGTTTDEMRKMVLETTNVTFGIDSVVKTFDLLVRAGVRNKTELKASAEAFDALADATGSSAEVVADILIPALKSLGERTPQTTEEMDKFTWLVKNTTIDLSEFGSVMGYVAMYGRDLNVSIDDMVGIMAALEARGLGGAEATRLFRTAVSRAKDGAITLNEALDLTQDEIDTYKDKIEDATGLTQKHADAMNKQLGIMDKVAQKWKELTLVTGSFLTPLEPILALMTALGPIMIALSLGILPQILGWIVKIGGALVSFLLNPITMLLVGLGLMGFGIYKLIKHHTDWNKIVEASSRVQEELAKSEGKLTDEVIKAQKAYNELREAYGQLSPEEEEHLARSNELIAAYEDGTYKLNEQTGALESTTKARKKSTEQLMAEADELHRVNTALQKELDLRNELMSVLGQMYPGGIPEEEFGKLITAGIFDTLSGARSPAMGYSGLGGYAGGGLITEPTWLTRVGQSRPYGMMAERRPEYITPGLPEITLVSNTYLDGDLISTKVERNLANKVRLQGGF